jgi:hypothetical protein
MSLRRGRPRYRVGYVAEVLQYLSWQYRKNHFRPVHVANSIACRDLSMGKTSWLRIVRVLEAAGWIRRDAKAGGTANKGSLYWLVEPPNGRHAPRPPSPIEPNGNRVRVPSDGVFEAPLSDPELANLISGVSHPNLGEGTLNRLRRYLTEAEPNTVKVLEIPSSGPLIRIAEGTLGVPSSPKGEEEGDGPKQGAVRTAAGNLSSPPGQHEAVATPPHSPSHRRLYSAGRGVPVRYSDGTEDVIGRSMPNAETLATIRELLGTPSHGPKARAYLEAVARLEGKEA